MLFVERPFMSLLITNFFSPLYLVCHSVPFTYVLKILTLISHRHIIAPTEPEQVLQQAMIPLYTPISKHTAFDTDILYGQFELYIYALLQPENQTSHNHNKGS